MTDKWEKEVKELTDKFEKGEISGVEFDKRFRELEVLLKEN